jgi:ribosome-binding factor A
VGGTRAEKMARIIREEASRVVLYELADPRIGFVTVTKVKVSPDLQHATVFVSVMGDEAMRKQTMSVLEGAAKVVQRAIGPRMKGRTMPMVGFEFDPSIAGSLRVSELIRHARSTDVDVVHAAGKAEPAVPAEGAVPDESDDESDDESADELDDNDEPDEPDDKTGGTPAP